MADDARVRPAFWPRWVPPRCRNGHPLLPGKVAAHYVNHECPVSRGPHCDGRGHDYWTCETTIDCHDQFWPPECVSRRTVP